MFNLLAFLQLIFSITAFYCGTTIYLRSPAYLPNRLLGAGYFIYGFPGMALFFSHIFPSVDLIRISVQIMVSCSAVGVGLIFLGTRTYFKGSFSFKRNMFILVIAVSLFIAFTAWFHKNAVIVLSIEPVNSELHRSIGIMIFVWHQMLALFSLHHLYEIRKSMIQLGDRECLLNIDYIIAGFWISLFALIVYTAGNFGEKTITDNIFFSLNVANLTCIWRGLRFNIENKQ